MCLLCTSWEPLNSEKGHISVPWSKTLSLRELKSNKIHGCTYAELLIWGLNTGSLDIEFCPHSLALGMANRFHLSYQC